METIAVPPQRAVLEARDLAVDIDGVQMLHQVSFRLYQRHIMCVIGENGSGKSLLLRALAGDYPLRSGRLIRDVGVDLFRISPEQVRVNGLLSVREFLAASTAAKSDALHSATSTYQLDPTQLVRTISSGERQRLLLAAADLARATITLFDLPVAELDSDGFDLAETLIRSLTERGGAVVVATTNPELVLRLDDCSLYRMSSGLLELIRSRPYDEVS